MDKLTAITLALLRLGEREYRENTLSADVCQQHYAPSLAYANARYPWSFARRMSVLKENPERRGYYALPNDCLKLLQMPASVTAQDICGGELYVENYSGDMPVKYLSNLLVSNEGNIPDNAPLFAKAFVTHLASEIAPALTGSQDLALTLAREAEEHFRAAILSDAQQCHSNDGSPMKNLLARWSRT